ncbi:MAG: ankyrin repeat domain-containing protein [Acidobacteria bacterium]|nr:ankyrin repeat domain-containing protein [Acidobacteriota bacterium]
MHSSTPLHRAAFPGYAEVVKLLLGHDPLHRWRCATNSRIHRSTIA